MFDGRAEETMIYYNALFPNSQIIEITRYKTKESGKEGTVIKPAGIDINTTNHDELKIQVVKPIASSMPLQIIPILVKN